MPEDTSSSSEEPGSVVDSRVADAERAAKVIERIREDMGDNWRQDDQLVRKFFPVEHTLKPRTETAQTRNYNFNKYRWKGVPETPRSPTALYTPLRMLMNNILLTEVHKDDSRRKFASGFKKAQSRQKTHSPRKKNSHRKASILIDGSRPKKQHRNEDPRRKAHPRRILATHARRKCVVCEPPSPISPTLYLAGAGPEFATSMSRTPMAKASTGISPIEIILDSDDLLAARDRLAASMFQMFYNQANRRFAYGLIMTETTCTVYMFDHSGAVASLPFEYHQDPAQLCAVIFGLGTYQAMHAGFDTSISGDGTAAHISTWESHGKARRETRYKIQWGLFEFPTLVGRGTLCWLTSKLDDPESLFVIKDAWIAQEGREGRESEGSLLRYVQSKGILHGVVQLQHFEEVRCGKNAEDLDTVLHNRRIISPTPEDLKLNRIHTRIVLKSYGKTLDNFRSRKELLFAFHDAVLAHRKLHDVAGILHRDVSVRNILIHGKGVEGNRGILIDFDHAIRVGDTSPYSMKTRIGTWRFMSRNVLEALGPHTYLDDLESFFFVLCWILMVYAGPGKPKAELPEHATYWDEPESAFLKRGQIAEDYFLLPVDPWFGDSFRNLAFRLHTFFNARRGNLGQPLSDLNPQDDYDEFLAHIHQCTVDMEAEDLASNQFQLSLSQQPGHAELITSEPQTSQKRSRDRAPDPDAGTAIAKRRRKTPEF